jgi:hypothetical protein
MKLSVSWTAALLLAGTSFAHSQDRLASSTDVAVGPQYDTIQCMSLPPISTSS